MTNPFQIKENEPQRQFGEPIESPEGETTIQQIENLVKSKVILFMKGNPVFPQCGFSARAIGILNSFNKPYNTFDILSDHEIRQELKTFANWPTYPQLWCNGQLVGGSDIMAELYENGELETVIHG